MGLLRGQVASRKHLLRRYNLTEDAYRGLLESQGYLCAICKLPADLYEDKTSRRLSVDHNHETGKVRGLLCNRCNTGLGNFEDCTSVLLEAAKYLQSRS